MVRIRVGESWKHNPSYVRGLVALAEGRSKGFSPRDIVDVLGIEVDGVDLAQGLAEAALLDAMGELVRAARSLAKADGEAQVALARAPVELKLSRSGDELRVSLRALDGGSALVRDAVVEPARFFEAVRTAARAFLDDLAAIHPNLGTLRVVQALDREAVRAPSKRPAPKRVATKASRAKAPEVERPVDPPLDPRPLPVRTAKSPAIRAPGMPAEGLRRLILRPAWRADAPGPRPRLSTAAGLVVVSSATEIEARRSDGERAWSLPLHEAVVAAEAATALVVGREAPGVFVVADAASGRRLGRVRASLAGLKQAMPLDGGLVAVTDGARVHGLDPAANRRAWTFEPGADRTLQLAGAFSGLVVATDTGEVVGLHPDGKVAFRTANVLSHTEAVRVAARARLAVVTGLDEDGRATVAAVSLDDGRLALRTTFDGLRPSAPVVVGGKVALGFEAKTGPVLATVDLRSGRTRFEASVPDDGAVSPFEVDGQVGVARVGGGLCLYAPDGRLAAHAGPCDPDPALSPVRARPVLTGAGLVVVASALVHVFDAQEGRLLASLEPAELAPESMALLDGPVIAAAGREGLVEAWRAFGHLRLVPGAE